MSRRRSKKWTPILATVGAALVAGWFGPWWAIAIPCAALGFLRQKALSAFANGAGAGGVAWLIAAAVQDIQTEGRLSGRIGGVLQVPFAHFVAYAATVAVAAALCGISAWLGFYIRDVLWPSPVLMEKVPMIRFPATARGKARYSNARNS